MFNRWIIVPFLSFFIVTGWAESVDERAALSVWVNEAIVATYTFDFNDTLAQQKQISHYFTSKGWIAFKKALSDSKLIENVKKNEYRVTAVATKPPEIKKKGTLGWQAVMPVLVFYQNPQYKQKQHLEITLDFNTAPSGQGVRGFAIDSFISKITKPACKCP